MDINAVIANLNTFLNWSATAIPWDLVIASGVLSPVLLTVKAWLKKHIESDKAMEKLMMSLVLVLGAVGSVVTYLVASTVDSPTIIAVHTFLIAAMSQPWYYLCFKPFWRWFSGELAKAKAFDAEVKSAAIPADGLPATSQQ